jgi:hypothetical protein
MMVRDELSSRFSNRCFAEQDHPFETRLFDAPHKSFSASVQVRASRRDPNGRHARFGEYVQELGREQRIAIVDQMALCWWSTAPIRRSEIVLGRRRSIWR